MFTFVLGVLFGSGLVLALQEIDLFLSVRRDARLNRAQDEAIEIADPSLAEQWSSGQWATDEDKVDRSWADTTGWDKIPGNDGRA